MKDDTYHFHQTPYELCKELVKHIAINKNDIVFEPFAGEGAFVKSFPYPENVITTEIEHGTDYKSIDLDKTKVDWVISNPPFRLDREEGKRTNSFYELVNYFSGKTRKGFAFLGNDRCFSVFTPKRLKYLYEEKGVYIWKIIVCNVKKWRGRYFFIVFRNKGKTTPINDLNMKLFDFIEGSY